MKSDINRRSFIKRGATLGGGVLTSGVLTPAARAKRRRGPTKSGEHPNVLVIMVDQMRSPQWFPDQQMLDYLLPNVARIRQVATSFENHYTAANMCVASRGALVTGLYPHQTGCMLTKLTTSSTLSPQFPTWGTMLREQGYETTWYGKWHISTAADKNPGGLEAYGFDGGTYPSPNGNPGQGTEVDPGIADQFSSWFEANKKAPWCTTVSFVNPHDINWWPRFTYADEEKALSQVDFQFPGGPGNTETTAMLQAYKPRLQKALQETMNVACGPVPDSGVLAQQSWARMLTLYLWYQQQVDAQIGRVLDTLHSNPAVAKNTVVIFTSDHGEYSGSHGLRCKGGGVYEESIHVPFYVVDPRGLLSSGRATTRTQYTSHVDLAPMLLTIAHGSRGWRGQKQYSQIASRADLEAIARNRRAPGRPWIAHVTDETTAEEFSYSYSYMNEVPHHVAAVRTPKAKYAKYSYWTPGTIDVEPGDQDFELYDYRTTGGRLELENVASENSQLRGTLSQLLESRVIPHELRQPLPSRLRAAQEEGLADFYARTNDPSP
jgi:arylsulfatase A-like enzyme